MKKNLRRKQGGDAPDRIVWPRTLDEFLREVVPAKTPADSTKRFRDFLKDEHREFYSRRAPEPERQQGEWPVDFEERRESWRKHVERHEKEVAELEKEGEIERRCEEFANQRMVHYGRYGISADSWPELKDKYHSWWDSMRRKKAANGGKARAKQRAKQRAESEALKKTP